jgi:hypothetical protein
MNNILEIDFEKYIGVPYKSGGGDLQGFDCLGLVDYILEKEISVKLNHSFHHKTRSDLELMKKSESLVKLLNQQHIKTKKPENFDLALMQKEGFFNHIGLFFKINENFGGVLHAMGKGNKGQVVFQRADGVLGKDVLKIPMWQNLTFYKLC